MALQGDLHSFALADVLRLLAGTTKTGRLDVAGDAGNGEVWFDRGDLVGGEVTTSPHAASSADVVFEMLRFENGTFRFDEGEVPPDTVERSDVDDAIAAAEDLLVRWVAIEAVVPSVHSWVSLVESVDADTITVSGDQWRLLAAIAGGSTPRRLGDRFELTDLESCAAVRDLVELGLVEVGESLEPTVTYDAVDIEPPTDPVADDDDDVFHLSAEDGPVVLETRDDALLPEPLPGEGTSFVGELDGLGTVDGRTYGTSEPQVAEAVAPDVLAPGVDDDDVVFESDADAPAPSWSSYGSVEAMVDDDVDLELAQEPVAEGAVEADPDAGLDVGDDEPAADVEREIDPVLAVDPPVIEQGHLPPAETLAEFEGADDDVVVEDDDRGSLLRFLSSVKP
ncbi:MAG: DUF4388 domain-containing protein [Actinobacteria bacterium]|nr:DUF4388 domain-containing protein [Actinomycetota bacterium]